MAKKADSEAPATAKVRYIGDGTAYVPGVPADPNIEQEFDTEQAHGLVGTGLFEFIGAAPARPEPAPEPDPSTNEGSGQEVSE